MQPPTFLVLILIAAIALLAWRTYLDSAGYKAKVDARAKRWAIDAENKKALNAIALETAAWHAGNDRAIHEHLTTKAAADAQASQLAIAADRPVQLGERRAS